MNQVSLSTDVYLSAGQINVQGNRVTTTEGKLDATQLTNTVPTGSISGSYTNVTGVGTLTAGTWNAAAVGAQYGGTGADLSAASLGEVPYFTANGVMSNLAAGTAGYLLQSNGAAAPIWVSSISVGSNLLSSTNTWAAQ